MIHYIINNPNSVIIGNSKGTGIVESYVSYTLGANLNNLTLEGIGNLTAQGNSLNDIIRGDIGNDVTPPHGLAVRVTIYAP